MTKLIKLHEIEPRENNGRDTIARFRAQFRAASIACLSILNGKDTDRVYCDYHDDFVVRKKSADNFTYDFYQVKTKAKRNYQWSVSDILALNEQKNKRTLEGVRDSFVGRLIIHSINFEDTCNKVTFMTNVQLKDAVENIISELESDSFENKHLKFIVDNFNDVFEIKNPITVDVIEKHLKKLVFMPGVSYLDPDSTGLTEEARSAIYHYSEIDLTQSEIEKIIKNLIDLVEKKSFARINDISEVELDNKAGIGIDDLLTILSISKNAYYSLSNGGDTKALKNASILYRKLKESGADEEMINFCAEQKVNWDVWVREKRNIIAEFEFNFMMASLSRICKKWHQNYYNLDILKKEIEELHIDLLDKKIDESITVSLLLGGFFSVLVRGEAR